jgi:2-methylcitrate dehydratase PrpD
MPPDLPALTSELGERWEILRTNIKRYPVGSPILGVVEGLNRLLRAAPIDAARIQRVVLTMPRLSALVVNERDMPNVNAQHIAAVMLLDGGLSLSASHDYARMQDVEVLALRGRVELQPTTEAETQVTVYMADGTSRTKRVEAMRRTPLPEDVERKAIELTGPLLGDARAAELVETLLHVERLDDVRELRPLLAASAVTA